MGKFFDSIMETKCSKMLKIGKHLFIETMPHSNTGEIHIRRNLGDFHKDQSIYGISIKFLSAIKKDLGVLAQLCQNKDPELRGIKFFDGSSHVAKAFKKFGFKILEIQDDEDLKLATNSSKIRLIYKSTHPDYWKYTKNYESAQYALISRKKLIKELEKGTYDDKE